MNPRLWWVFLTLIIISLSTGASPRATLRAPQMAAPNIEAHVFAAEVGKNFEDILVSHGFDRQSASHLLKDPIIPTKMHVNPKEKYLVVNDRDSGAIEIRIYLDFQDEALVFWKNPTAIGVTRQPVAFKVKRHVVNGLIRGSLVESIKAILGGDDWPAFRFLDAFAWDLNIGRNSKKDDSFKFVIEEKYDFGKFVKFGEILDAELKTQGEQYKRVLWQQDAAKVFVDAESTFEARPFFAPVDYLHISSPFNMHRFHPVRRNVQPHLGVDFALPEGSPIYAAFDGVVIDATKHRGNGRFVSLSHPNDFVTIYNHLSAFAEGIVPGQPVQAGQVIGYVGCTGFCTSPHLHFSIRKGRKMFNPVHIMKPYPFHTRDYWTTNKFKELLGVLTTQN